MTNLPLTGIKVIDFTGVQAGPATVYGARAYEAFCEFAASTEKV